MTIIERLKFWARTIKRDIVTLWLAVRHPAVPWYSKAIAAATVTYALSPIDLIPDFVPVLGYLDDLIIVPLGIMISIRLIPDDVLAELRAQAAAISQPPASRIGMAVVVTLWTLTGLAIGWWFYRLWRGG